MLNQFFNKNVGKEPRNIHDNDPVDCLPEFTLVAQNMLSNRDKSKIKNNAWVSNDRTEIFLSHNAIPLWYDKTHNESVNIIFDKLNLYNSVKIITIQSDKLTKVPDNLKLFKNLKEINLPWS